MSTIPDADVDRILFAVCSLHDGSDLWEHTRRDPDAFRNAVRAAATDRGEVRRLRAALREALDGWAVWASGDPGTHPDRPDSMTDAGLGPARQGRARQGLK